MPWLATFSDNDTAITANDFDYGIAFRITDYSLVLSIDFTYTATVLTSNTYTAIGHGEITLPITAENIPADLDETGFAWDDVGLTNQPMLVDYSLESPVVIGTVVATMVPTDPLHDAGTFDLTLILLKTDMRYLLFDVTWPSSVIIPPTTLTSDTDTIIEPPRGSLTVTIPNRTEDESRTKAIYTPPPDPSVTLSSTSIAEVSVAGCLGWGGKWNTSTGRNISNPLVPP